MIASSTINNIQLLPWTTNYNHILNDYKNIDILIIPSEYEPYGLIACEATELYKPFLYVESTWPTEIATILWNQSLSFNPDHQNDLLDKCFRCISHYKHYVNNIIRNYNIIYQKYNRENATNAISQIIESIKK